MGPPQYQSPLLAPGCSRKAPTIRARLFFAQLPAIALPEHPGAMQTWQSGSFSIPCSGLSEGSVCSLPSRAARRLWGSAHPQAHSETQLSLSISALRAIAEAFSNA